MPRSRRGTPARPDAGGSLLRRAIAYGALSLVPVVLLGGALFLSYRHEAERRGLAEGRSEAQLMAQTAIEPVLDAGPLGSRLSPSAQAALTRIVHQAVWSKKVLRLRLRNLDARVVFSDDGSGFADKPEDEALDAASGHTVALLTRLNSDKNDTGEVGPAAVEVYLPLVTGQPAVRVGVLEAYLPYAPIQSEVAAGLGMLYRNLALGLGLLWLVLLGIAWSMSRGLRRQVHVNAHQASHDALTGLPNRLLFHRRANEVIAAGHTVTLALLDLDRFKEINDTLGHDNGDRLLREIAGRLRGAIDAGDTVARLGGDEFGLILHAGGQVAAGVLAQLREVIVEELDVSGLPIAVEASVGYVVADLPGTDVDTLLRRAEVAMYVAKARHAGVAEYDPSFDHYDATKLGLIAELRHAIDAGELVLHYQPKSRLDGGEGRESLRRRVTSFEALVRWNHPRLGMLPPDRFVPLAEQTELIDRLTEWVLDRALTDLRALPSGAAVAVNVSARNLARADFADSVAAALARAGVAAERLTVEITETAVVQDPERATRVLRALAAAGVRISLDDFGAGQTSLGQLSSLPVHELKVDRCFVTDIPANRAHGAIVRSVVELGHNLSMSVVAEGVETDDALDALRRDGCDVIQGYLLAAPMSLDDLRLWLSAREPDQNLSGLSIGR